MDEQMIVIETDSVEEAKEQLKARLPEGYSLQSGWVASVGKPRTAKTSGVTVEVTLASEHSQSPEYADILGKRGSACAES